MDCNPKYKYKTDVQTIPWIIVYYKLIISWENLIKIKAFSL